MTRETKAGLVVSCSFLCLVGVVLVSKLREQGGADGSGTGENGGLAAAPADPRPVEDPSPQRPADESPDADVTKNQRDSHHTQGPSSTVVPAVFNGDNNATPLPNKVTPSPTPSSSIQGGLTGNRGTQPPPALDDGPVLTQDQTPTRSTVNPNPQSPPASPPVAKSARAVSLLAPLHALLKRRTPAVKENVPAVAVGAPKPSSVPSPSIGAPAPNPVWVSSVPSAPTPQINIGTVSVGESKPAGTAGVQPGPTTTFGQDPGRRGSLSDSRNVAPSPSPSLLSGNRGTEATDATNWPGSASTGQRQAPSPSPSFVQTPVSSSPSPSPSLNDPGSSPSRAVSNPLPSFGQDTAPRGDITRIIPTPAPENAGREGFSTPSRNTQGFSDLGSRGEARAPLGAPVPAVSAPLAAALPAGQFQPQVESYDEETFTCRGSETFRTISRSYYRSERYEQALYLFNRNHPLASDAVRQDPPRLQPGQQVYIPPVRILEKYYASAINDAATAAAPVTSGDAQIRPTAPPASAFVPTAATKTYRVRGNGEMFREIARRTLNDSERWVELYRLNPRYDPMYPVPAGADLAMPRDAIDTP